MAACREFTSAVDVINQMIGERMGVNRTDHRVLEILNRKGAMTAGDLARASHLTTGAVTAVLDRLEEAGYVRRVRDTEDRRRVLVEQTLDSTKTAMRYYQPYMATTFDSMAKYSAEELAVVRDFMRGAAELSDGYAEELREAGEDEPNDAEAG
jgi:DNA-binding MarR family transcriptional regulator